MPSEPAHLADTITKWMAEIPVTPPPHPRSYCPSASDASPLASPKLSLSPLAPTRDFPGSPVSHAPKHCFRVSAHSSSWPDPEDLYYV